MNIIYELSITVVASAILGLILELISNVLPKLLLKHKKKNPDSLLANKILKKFYRSFDISVSQDDRVSYKERIEKTLGILKKASREVTKATDEFNSIMHDKQISIDGLEAKLNELSSKESELKDKIDAMQKVPMEALKYFEDVLNKGNKRSAWRDYILFLTGVIVSTIVSIILMKFS